MKKIVLGSIALSVAAALVSCGGNSSANMKSAEDSVSVAIGVTQGAQTAQSFQMQKMYGGPEIDSAEFLRGFKEGASNVKKFSFYAGAITGVQLAMNVEKDSTQELNMDLIVKGFEAAVKRDTTGKVGFTTEQAQKYLQEYFQRKQAKENEKKFGKNKEDGVKYLDSLVAAGYTKDASGIVYKVQKGGQGESPKASDRVSVRYVGKLINGTEFDKSDRDGKNEPVSFALSGVVPGFREMLMKMKPGEKVFVAIPQELAYGANGSGQLVEPFSTITFELELVAVNPAEKTPAKK